jgi:hypothetical protein
MKPQRFTTDALPENPSADIGDGYWVIDFSSQVTFADVLNDDEVELIEETPILAEGLKNDRIAKLMSPDYVTPGQKVDPSR